MITLLAIIAIYDMLYLLLDCLFLSLTDFAGVLILNQRVKSY